MAKGVLKTMATAETRRFEQKRNDVVHAASTLINEVGVKGMTFGSVAAEVGLNPTSITYYFNRKELLVVAVYEETLARMEQMATEAASGSDPQDRVARWLKEHIALRLRIRNGERGLLTALSEIRTLDEASQQPLLDHYRRIVRIVKGFFGEPRNDTHRALIAARAHILLEAMFWWPVWSSRYSTLDFGRVEKRMFDILAHGVAGQPGRWEPQPLNSEGWRTPQGTERSPLDQFLEVATQMVNQRGYRGASVNRIASQLNVTKGSFYHHHDAKDTLVLDCFQRSYDRLSAAQLAGVGVVGDWWTRLSSSLAELIDLQFNDPMPLLRTTALQVIPSDDRGNVVLRSNRLARRFAGMLIDGIADGSVRPIDPLIASQIIMSTLNSAYEARKWAARLQDPALAVKLYVWTLTAGLFSDPPEV